MIIFFKSVIGFFFSIYLDHRVLYLLPDPTHHPSNSMPSFSIFKEKSWQVKRANQNEKNLKHKKHTKQQNP